MSAYVASTADCINECDLIAASLLRQRSAAYVSIRQHTSAYLWQRSAATRKPRVLYAKPALPSACACIRQHTSAYVSTCTYVSIRQRTSAYVSICQHMSAYVSIRQHLHIVALDSVSVRQHTSAYVSLRQRTSAYVSVRQHTSAYVSIRRARTTVRMRLHGLQQAQTQLVA
jgi:hypothetical protein